jgi:uncharacterized protein YlxP (DUF503 family)
VVIGAISWDLLLPGCISLKDKRSVVRSLKDRMRHRFNVGVSETHLREAHARAGLTAVFVSTEGRHAESIRGNLARFVETDGRVVVLAVRDPLA